MYLHAYIDRCVEILPVSVHYIVYGGYGENAIAIHSDVPWVLIKGQKRRQETTCQWCKRQAKTLNNSNLQVSLCCESSAAITLTRREKEKERERERESRWKKEEAVSCWVDYQTGLEDWWVHWWERGREGGGGFTRHTWIAFKMLPLHVHAWRETRWEGRQRKRKRKREKGKKNVPRESTQRKTDKAIRGVQEGWDVSEWVKERESFSLLTCACLAATLALVVLVVVVVDVQMQWQILWQG